MLGENYLPDLQTPCTKWAGRAKKVIFPHAIKTVVVSFLQAVPTAVEIFEPRHESPVVIKAEIMHIFDNKQVIQCSADLTHRRNKGVGENIFAHPGVVHLFRPAVSNCMQEKKSIIIKTFMNKFHISPVISPPDMLEHSNRHNMVKCFIKVTIVL